MGILRNRTLSEYHRPRHVNVFRYWHTVNGKKVIVHRPVICSVNLSPRNEYLPYTHIGAMK